MGRAEITAAIEQVIKQETTRDTDGASSWESNNAHVLEAYQILTMRLAVEMLTESITCVKCGCIQKEQS